MNISIFGLGYVGTVSAACLAERGHRVVGVDVRGVKVEAINEGRSPVVEPGLDELVQQARAAGRLSATLDAAEALRGADVSIVCVGTPPTDSGRLNLDMAGAVCAQMAAVLRELEPVGIPAVTGRDRAGGRQAARDTHSRDGLGYGPDCDTHSRDGLCYAPHVILLRSTLPPGGTRRLVAEHFSDLVDSGRVQVGFCPEFLREGVAIADFREPALNVIGTADGLPPDDRVLDLLGADVEVMRWEEAEMLKLACNAFHALKAGFANEIGRLAKKIGADGARVMEVLSGDSKLNASPRYLRPGNPFGGSCLPKDVAALTSLARREGVALPILEHTLASNDAHLESLLRLVARHETRRVGLLGLSFKAGTDDLRGSPMVALAETLLGRGYQLRIYDPQINLSRLIGANESEMQRRLPHLAALLRATPGEVLAESDVIVAAQVCADVEALRAQARAGHWFIDVNGWEALKELPGGYEGFCW